jgi:hypothetical protein
MYLAGLATITLQASESSGSPLGGLIVLLLIVGVVVVLGLRARSAENVRAGLLLAHPPAECIDAVMGYMVQRGFAVTYRGDTTATFTRPKKPNMDIGCLLLLLGLVPGLLYFGLYKGTLTTTVTALCNGAAGTHPWSREMTSAPETMSSGGHERTWQ